MKKTKIDNRFQAQIIIGKNEPLTEKEKEMLKNANKVINDRPLPKERELGEYVKKTRKKYDEE